MADENTNPSPSSRVRRSSFAGETFANLFGGHRASVSRQPSQSNSSNGDVKQSQPEQQQQQPTQSYPGPITTAAAQAQKRRLSLTTLGLSGSPNQPSSFGNYNGRRDSYVSGASDSIDESAIEDDYGPAAPAPTPATPFGRRLSFGAKALRDVKTGGGGNTPPGQNGQQASAPSNANNSANGQKAHNGTISSRDAKGRGNEGFNWSDNFRSRAERTSIASGGMSGFMSGGGAGSPRSAHGRAQSVAIMEPPVREMPKPKEQVRPDHFQERILKGDFYMD